jgi:MraZ protein
MHLLKKAEKFSTDFLKTGKIGLAFFLRTRYTKCKVAQNYVKGRISPPKWQERRGDTVYGKSEHTLDSKGRLCIPARLLPELGDSFIITANGCTEPDGTERHYLTLFPKGEWELLQKNMMADLEDEEAEDQMEFLFGYANDCSLDSSGRVQLTADQREYAQLGKSVFVVGNNTVANIWDVEIWKAHQQKRMKPGMMRSIISRNLAKRPQEEG